MYHIHIIIYMYILYVCSACCYIGGNLSAVYNVDDFGDLYIWEETEVYYSPNGGFLAYSIVVLHTESLITDLRSYTYSLAYIRTVYKFKCGTALGMSV